MFGMIKILLFIALALPVFGQSLRYDRSSTLFAVSDTIFDTGASDTLKYRIWIGGEASNWYTLDSTITTAEKVSGDNEFIPLSNDANWFWGEYVEMSITNTTTITSSLFTIGNKNGAVSAILKPDSVNTDTLLYNGSWIGGN